MALDEGRLEAELAGPPPGGKVRLILVGLGPIGLAVAAEANRRPNLLVVGGVDISPLVAGQDLGQAAWEGTWNKPIRPDLEEALAEWKPAAAVVTTVSQVARLETTLLSLVRHGVNVVSAAEELLVPDHRSREAAGRIDAAARRAGVTVVAAGANPGFVMDLLPVFLSSACRRVDSVQVFRCLDAGTRRESLQRRAGLGLTVEAFRTEVREGRVGHRGFQESLLFLCRGLGWNPDRLEENLEPVEAKHYLKTDYVEIHSGRVAGLHQTARAWRGDRILAELDLKMIAGAEYVYDRVRIEGDPALDVRLEGGVPGDASTVAALLNAVPLAVAARPGLLTPLELALPRGRGA